MYVRPDASSRARLVHRTRTIDRGSPAGRTYNVPVARALYCMPNVLRRMRDMHTKPRLLGAVSIYYGVFHEALIINCNLDVKLS